MLILVLTECYANKGFAEALLERCSQSFNLMHDETFGRDKIVKKLFRHAKKSQYKYLLGIIDYEKGASRIYIEKHIIKRAFAFKSFFDNKVHVYILKYEEAIITVIVFDPMIEEVLKEADPEIMVNPKKYKHEDGERESYRIFSSNQKYNTQINMIIEFIKQYLPI